MWVIGWPQSLRAVPAPACVPHGPQSLQKCLLPRVRLQPLSSPLWVSPALRANALSYVYQFMASSTTGQPYSPCYRNPNSYARYILL